MSGLGLVEHALVPLSGGAGLVGVHPGDEQQSLPHLVLELGQAQAVLQHRVLPVGGAGADDHQKFPALPLEHSPDLPVPAVLLGGQGRGQRVLLLQLPGAGQGAVVCHRHRVLLLSCEMGGQLRAEGLHGGMAVPQDHVDHPGVQGQL